MTSKEVFFTRIRFPRPDSLSPDGACFDLADGIGASCLNGIVQKIWARRDSNIGWWSGELRKFAAITFRRNSGEQLETATEMVRVTVAEAGGDFRDRQPAGNEQFRRLTQFEFLQILFGADPGPTLEIPPELVGREIAEFRHLLDRPPV